MDDLVYAGDLTPSETWARLEGDGDAVLVDVRTMAEWNYVGVPDLSDLGKQAMLIEWQLFPQMDVNQGFVASLEGELSKSGKGKDTPIFMLCRSGVRSRAAAAAMTAAGYGASFNILEGFEGNPDNNGHRGNTGGWKVAGLPWRQN